MKSFKNELTEVALNGEQKAKYSDFSLLCLNKQEPGGLTNQQVFERSRVIGFVDRQKDKNEIVLEDADHAILMGCVDTMRWPMPHEAFAVFIDAVKHATAHKKDK